MTVTAKFGIPLGTASPNSKMGVSAVKIGQIRFHAGNAFLINAVIPQSRRRGHIQQLSYGG